jgi:hypothetical protein
MANYTEDEKVVNRPAAAHRGPSRDPMSSEPRLRPGLLQKSARVRAARNHDCPGCNLDGCPVDGRRA